MKFKKCLIQMLTVVGICSLSVSSAMAEKAVLTRLNRSVKILKKIQFWLILYRNMRTSGLQK